MDHTYAVEKHAAERYLLGELSASEAEEFERHYFECQDCALAVESCMEFRANARAVFDSPAAALVSEELPARRSSWWSFSWRPQWSFGLASAAAAVCFAVVLYQGVVVIPGLRQVLNRPVLLPAFQLAGATRGELSRIRIPRAAPFLPLSADVPPDVHFSQYVFVLTRSGQVVFRTAGDAPPANQSLVILVPAVALSDGEYEIAVYGAGTDGRQSDKIVTYPFQFQFQ